MMTRMAEPPMNCVRCRRPVFRNAAMYETFERMHWVSFTPSLSTRHLQRTPTSHARTRPARPVPSITRLRLARRQVIESLARRQIRQRLRGGGPKQRTEPVRMRTDIRPRRSSPACPGGLRSGKGTPTRESSWAWAIADRRPHLRRHLRPDPTGRCVLVTRHPRRAELIPCR